MTPTLVRLAFTGIRSRLLASALTVVIAAAAVATIVIALEVRGTGTDPWQHTFAEANGAHVLAFVPSRAEAVAIGRLPSVTEHAAPVPLVSANLGSHGSTHRVELAGLGRRVAVNRPLPSAGSQLRAGGIVLERSLAHALGIEVGAKVEVATRHRSVELPVLGTAVVPSQPRYPRSKPGLAWVTQTRSHASIRIAHACAGQRPFAWRGPPRLPRSRRGRRPGFRRELGDQVPSPSRRGRPSATSRSATRKARRSS